MSSSLIVLIDRLYIMAFITILHVSIYRSNRKKGRHVGFVFERAAMFGFFFTFPITYFLFGSIDSGQAFLSYLINYAVYSTLLLALTPLLRKRYSAELCADLWLLPNISWLILAFGSRIVFTPVVILRIGRVWFLALLGVWASGFLTVFGWKIVSHLRFRRQLLRRAVQDERLAYAYIEQRYKLLPEAKRDWNHLPNWKKAIVYSPDAASPLSIGLFKRRIVLPQRQYTDEELKLILRHETTHLIREDNGTKFYLSFLSACYWFLPTSWLGLSRAAEDMELCCDEIATARLTPEERKQYAELLLSNAGTAPGFTTCLSASADGLRYRLQRVLHPIQTKSGVALLTAVMLLFLLCLNAVGVAPGVGGMDRVAFDGIADAESIVMWCEDKDDPQEWKYHSCDEDALRAALVQTEGYRADDYLKLEASTEELKLGLQIIGKTRAVEISFYETYAYVEVLKLTPKSGGTFLGFDTQNRRWEPVGRWQTYLYDTPPDWDALYALAGDELSDSSKASR